MKEIDLVFIRNWVRDLVYNVEMKFFFVENKLIYIRVKFLFFLFYILNF